MLEICISLLFLGSAGYLIAKNYDAKIILFFSGIILMFAAVVLGHEVVPAAQSTGSVWLDPLKKVTQVFTMQMGIVGLTIMVLFGFSSYMNSIGANDVTVHLISKPVKYIKSPYILVPVIFILGNLMSIVLPSAAGLAVLLMATLYPVMRTAGMTALTAGAVIATTATITPTPLGSDNIVVAGHLKITALEYVTTYHAWVSIPSLLVIAAVHYFWQKRMDKRQNASVVANIAHEKLTIRQDLPPAWYAIFPILPIILVFFFGLAFLDENNKSTINVGLVEITVICLVLAIVTELIRKRSFQATIKEFTLFFEGMGTGFSQVVSLIIAAGVFVEGLKSIGVINMLVDSVKDVQGVGSILMLFFSALTALIGFISGSGIAVFHSFIKIIPEITENLGVNTVSVALPMQLTANLIRAMSPVAAVVIVVASVIKVSPLEIIKRTSVPLTAGIISCLVLSYLWFQLNLLPIVQQTLSRLLVTVGILS